MRCSLPQGVCRAALVFLFYIADGQAGVSVADALPYLLRAKTNNDDDATDNAAQLADVVLKKGNISYVQAQELDVKSSPAKESSRE